MCLVYWEIFPQCSRHQRTKSEFAILIGRKYESYILIRLVCASVWHDNSAAKAGRTGLCIFYGRTGGGSLTWQFCCKSRQNRPLHFLWQNRWRYKFGAAGCGGGETHASHHRHSENLETFWFLANPRQSFRWSQTQGSHLEMFFFFFF
jgi:hypothetical protein